MILKHISPLFAALLFSVAAFPTHARAGESLVTNGDFTNNMDGWSLNKMENTEATSTIEPAEKGKQAIHINVPQAGAKRYFVQLVHKSVPLHADKTYHLHFRARSKPAGEIVVLAAYFHGKYEELWRQEKVTVKEEWADYSFDFKPKDSDDDAQIIFSGLAAQAGGYWFTDVTLTAGE